MLLSALYVRFRDVEPIWDVILQVLFYGSPILYAIEIVPSDTARQVIMCNPIADDPPAGPPLADRPGRAERPSGDRELDDDDDPDLDLAS